MALFLLYVRCPFDKEKDMKKILLISCILVLTAVVATPLSAQIVSGAENPTANIVVNFFNIVGQSLHLWEPTIIASGNSIAIGYFALSTTCFKQARVDINSGNWTDALYQLQKTNAYLRDAIQALTLP